MLKHLGPIVATSVVVLFLLVSAVPLMHWFQSDSQNLTYEDNRARWQELDIQSYRFALDMSCDCSDLPDMPVKIVIDGYERPQSTGSQTRDRTKPPVLPRSIDAVFEFAQASIDAQPDELIIDYDADYGFPRSIFLDPDIGRIGDETSVRIVDFDPRVADLRE